MSSVEDAVACFKERLNCAQAVLSAYCEELGLGRETALKIATPFGAGMARMGETCGAVTGAFMVIGLKHGRTKADDEEAKEKTYSLMNEFMEKFRSRNTSIVCNVLLGFDISTPEGLQRAKEKDVHSNVCPKFVQDASEILEELLEEQE
ncbi:MAG: C-GCAxxG-C-C family protein [bacterium]